MDSMVLIEFLQGIGRADMGTATLPYADDDLQYALKNEVGRRRALLGEDVPVYAEVPRLVRHGKESGNGCYTVRNYQVPATASLPVGGKPGSGKALALLYEIDVDDGSYASIERTAHSCPNCGAPSTIGELVNGCEYCGTRYEVSDMFPRIFGYAVSRSGFERFSSYAPIAIFAGVLAVLFAGMPLWSALKAGGVWLGAFLAAMIGMLVALFFSSRHHGRHLRKLEEDLRQARISCPIEYIEADVVSTLRKAMFAPDLGLYPHMECKPDVSFADIIAADYDGRLDYRGMSIEDGIVEVRFRITMFVQRVRGGSITEQRERYDVEARRSLDNIYDPMFSEHAVNCPGCAGSFDPLARKTCPYCGREYDFALDSWVITKCGLGKVKPLPS